MRPSLVRMPAIAPDMQCLTAILQANRAGLEPSLRPGTPGVRPQRLQSGFRSPHQRRVTNKPEPRFHRKHGGVLAFGPDLQQRCSTEFNMSTTHQDKSGGKARQRSRKADQRGQKPAQRQSPKPDRPDEDRISPIVASTEAPTSGAAALAEIPLIGEVLPPHAPSIGTAAPAENFPVILQTMANAYGDYTRKSFEEGRSFVEKLMGVRSFDKAIEIQTEFTRQAYANFVAESQKVCQLYGELAMQIFRPWEGIMGKLTPAGRQIS